MGSGHDDERTQPSATPHATTGVRQDVTMQPSMSCRNYYPWPRRELTHTRPDGAPSLPQRWTAEGRKPSLVPACRSALLGGHGGPAHNQGWPDWTAGLGRQLSLDPKPLHLSWATPSSSVALGDIQRSGRELRDASCTVKSAGCWLLAADCFMPAPGDGERDGKEKND